VTASVIDCDVHCAVRNAPALYPYLPAQFRELLGTRPAVIANNLAIRQTYPDWLPMLATKEEDLTLDAVRAGVLATPDSRAILNCYFGTESFTHPYFGPALATAVNSWMQEQWLAKDDRFYGSAVVTPDHTAAAVREIERVSADPRVVQIIVPAQSPQGYGHQRFWPIWEAAADKGLVVAITYGGATGMPQTPVGYPSSFFERYANAVTSFQANILSLVASGVFSRAPNLRFALLESGWTWLPGFLWRFDEHWRSLNREIPWVDEAPTNLVRRHFRVTTNPIDAPPNLDDLVETIDQAGGAEMLMFGSDFPHVYELGISALSSRLSTEQMDQIMTGNARSWYRLATA